MKNKFLIIIVLLAIFSISASLFARWTPLFPGDLRLILFLQTFSNGTLRSIMAWASLLFGDWHAVLLVIPAGILVWWRIGNLEGLAVWGSGIISLVNELFKIAVNRPRPSPEQVQVIGTNQGTGYPSCHAFFAIIFLGFLAYLLFSRLGKRSLRILSLIFFIMVMLLVGTSRIYLGAHWPSDVLGGYLIGGLFLTLLIWSYEFLKGRLRIKKK
jgi:membrane-associated phospholipid phosphatase